MAAQRDGQTLARPPMDILEGITANLSALTRVCMIVAGVAFVVGFVIGLVV
jgi:hypothetical protein